MKTKKPITQSITNRREHSSRFKAMFYVIGFVIQSRVLLSTAPANRTKGMVEQFGTFRSTESVSGRPDISQYDRTVYSVVYVAVNRCAIIIQIMLYVVKGVKVSHYIQNFKRQISTNAENNSLSVRTFDEEKSTAQKSVPTWHELFLKKFCPTWAEFSKSTSRQLVGNIKLPLLTNLDRS